MAILSVQGTSSIVLGYVAASRDRSALEREGMLDSFMGKRIRMGDCGELNEGRFTQWCFYCDFVLTGLGKESERMSKKKKKKKRVKIS